MQQRQINKPISVNLDKSKKYLTPTEAFYMLNRERNINGTGTLGKTTPLVANYLACQIEQPAGDNYTIGHCFSKLTNELYWFTYNSNGVNYVARMNGDGTCQIVYDGDCLPLSAAPEHAIEEWRCYLKYDRFCAHQHGKQLIWTNGLHEIGQLDVEASIATDSFRTPFFENNCPDPCAYTEMCVPEPCGALEGEFVTLPASEVDLNNHVVDVGIKVAFFHIYYDKRESTMSDISTLYYQDSKGCFDLEEGLPRCIKFTVPLGNPLVDKIEFVYSTDNGLTWKSSDIIEKYQPYINAAQYWYQRDLADLPDLDLVNCTFSYTFCNDKECNPIDPVRSSRVFNPLPRQPQGLIRIKNSLGFYNYVKGNCPINGTETKKFEISSNCQNANNCVTEYAEVTVRVIVHNVLLDRNGLVYRLGGNLARDPDDENDNPLFGASFNPVMQQQVFFGKTRNFIPYIEATNYWGQMKQWRASALFTNPIEVGMVSGMNIPEIRNGIFSDIENGDFFYQEYKFKVRKGERGFIRLAGHAQKNGLPSEGQDTSTQVMGTIPSLSLYQGNMVINSIMTYTEKELYFDTCAGDVVLDKVLVVNDGYRIFQTGANSSCAFAGYLTDANNRPVEGAQIWYSGLARAVTDFNGFFHFSLYGSQNNQTITVDVRVETDCGGIFNTIKTATFHSFYGGISVLNIQISDLDIPTDYKSNYYSIVNVSLKDCDNLPVGGIRIALSGTKYQVTDAVTGIATFNVRNYVTRNRSVKGVVMDANGCFTFDCSDGCNPCLPITADTLLSACFVGKPVVNIATTTNLNKNIYLAIRQGLKAGGRYPFGIVAQGSCGRISAVYPATILNGSLPELSNYLNIPKTQEKNGFGFCNYTYDATGMVLPDWVDCLKIVRGTNINNYELQWIVDKIERTADRKIKLTIQSLNDYNARYNFETNTLYQYIKGDRVEIISNGNGDVFDITTYGLLNYQILSPFHDVIISGEDNPPANFFNQILIADDGKLDSLTVGAKIELQRSKECTVEPTYFEIASLPVIEISGQRMLAYPTGTFTTFDTFIVNRNIEGGLTQMFEHKFPSDFWGHDATQGIFTGLSDIGKPHFTNKFENEKRYGRNITINSENKFNRFGDLEKTLDAPEQGDIIAMGIYDGKIGLGIGEFDSSLFQISDEFLRVGSNGMVMAAPADSLVSDTQPKVSGIFGCRYDSIGSIYFGDGWVTWVDKGKAAFVKHDFNIAKDISEGKFNTWVKKTVQYMENFNRAAPNDISKIRWSSGMNYHTNALQLTVKGLNQSGINNEQQPFITYRSTLLIEPRTEELLTFASYTQEAYSNLVLNDSYGCAFISFYLGQPYIHPVIPIKFNEFNGTAVDSIVGISIHHESGDKEINPMAMEVQCETMWFAKKVTVDDTTFESEIPPIRWKKTMDKWNAGFLNDKNSRGGLYGNDPRTAGKKPRGYFCAVILIRDNTDALKYGTTNDVKRVAFDELDLIISKASFSEQSGFQNNV